MPKITHISARLGPQFRRWRALLAVLAAGVLAAPASAQNAPLQGPQLYALDCGRFVIYDLGRLSDTFEHTGERGELVSPCWLVRHPKGTLIWDLGLGDRYANHSDGVAFGSLLRFFVPVTLVSQLTQLGLAPADVNLVAVSHLRLDHLGNAPLFAGATWVMNRRELAFGQQEPPQGFIDPQLMQVVTRAKKTLIDGDYDVFGDGTVRILRAPGHTPGSQVLLLRLPHSGAVILSGDLAHSRTNYEQSLMHSSNDSRADTLASIDRVRRLVRNLNARLVIHHDVKDFGAMPRFPAYLD